MKVTSGSSEATGNKMKRFGRTLLAGILLVVSVGIRADISAHVDRQQAALGDTLRLTLVADDGEDIGDLDLGPLERDFEVLGRSSSTKTSIINGRYSSSKELLLDITPRRQGTAVIPALQLDGKTTNPLQVNVGPPPSGDSSNQAVVFEAQVDRDSVYVQGQVILTLRVQESINLEDRSLTDLKLDNAFVHPLEQQSFQRTVNGRPRLVHEVRYAIFPEQSGTLTIPAQTYAARERGPRRGLFDLGSSGRQLRRQTKPLQIEVLPRPDTYPRADWLPATELTVEESWSTPPEQLRVGESATRTVTIRGVGLQGAQLPPVLYPATRGLKFYPDQPEITDGEASSGLVGTRVDSVAIVPTRAGTWQIPEVRIPWWDTRTDELRYAVLPAQELQVMAADPATLPSPPVGQTAPVAATGAELAPAAGAPDTGSASDTRLWQLVSAVTALGWLSTLAYLLYTRRRRESAGPQEPPRRSNETRAFKDALAACDNGDAAAARTAVLAWAAQLSTATPPTSLAQVAALLDDVSLCAALDSLDRTLYGGAASTWDGAELAGCLRQLRSQRREGKPEQPDFQLYPQGA